MQTRLSTAEFLEFIWGDNDGPAFGYIYTEPPPNPDPTVDTPWKALILPTADISSTGTFVEGQNVNPKCRGLFYMPVIMAEARNQRGRLLRTNNPENNKLKRGFRTFFLDMDCGEGKPYSNPLEALKAISPFLKTTGLPNYNCVVNSGRGLHVYWVADEIIALPEWVRMATMLKALCKEHGLNADPGITADMSRVLRLPGSYNRKDMNNPKPCTASKIGDVIPVESLTAVLLTVPAQAKLTISSALSGEASDDLRGNVGNKPSFMKQVVARCQYFGHLAETGGKNCDEPMWMQAINVCTFAEDGPEWSHIISRGHSDYSEETTDAKYAHRLQVQGAQPEISATRCETLESVDSTGCDLCDGCEYKGKIKSPIQLGRGEVEASVAAADDADLLLPKGYTRNAAGHVWKATVNKDGEPSARPVAPGIVILELELVRTAASDAEFLVTLHFALDRQSSVTLPESEYQRPGFAALLAQQGLGLVTITDVRMFKEFILSWIQELKSAGLYRIGSQRLGWPDASDGTPPIYSNFNLGHTSHYPDGSEAINHAAKAEGDTTYLARGKKEPWDEAVKLVLAAHQPALNTILAASFASPLMKLTNLTGAGVSIHSPASGVGKTSALRVAQSIWGDPISGVTSMNDTLNATVARASSINNLPLFWDEVRSQSTMEGLGDTLFAIIQGRGKRRCDKTGKLRDSIGFNTLLVTTSNHSLLSVIEMSAGSSAAGNARMLEFLIDKPSDIPVGGDEIFGALNENYGHAGIIYAKYLAANQTEIRKQIIAMGKAIRKTTGATNEERLWVNTMAALLVGAGLAKKLGLVDFDMKSLWQYYGAMLVKSRSDTDTSKDNDTAARALSALLMNLAPRTIRSSAFRGAGKTDIPTIVSQAANRNASVAVHSNQKTNVIRIRKDVVIDELSQNRAKYGYTPREFAAALEREGLQANYRYRYFPLAGGAEVSYMRTNVLEVTLTGVEFPTSAIVKDDLGGQDG